MANQSGKRPPLEIHVTGVSKLSQRAERCFLTVAVTSSGESQETVSTDVTTTGNQLQKLFQELSLKTDSGEPTPVTTLSIGSLHNTSSVPRDRDGKPLPRIYSATLSFNVTFRDFQKLSEVGSILLTTPHVEIRSTIWKLTDETTKRLGTESRQLALRDAIQKAEEYAQVLGRNVVPLEVRDDGSSHSGGRAMMVQMQQQYKGESSRGGIALEPENVELHVSIAVKFASFE